MLSPAFFEKKWPQYELDGLAEREMSGRDKVILPIWHGVGHDDVMEYSPSLAGRVSVKSADGLQRVVDELLNVVRPQGSPLIAARDFLLDWGVAPPVITDQYWLDVAEASNRLAGFGPQIPDEATWHLWSFPLPPKGDSAETWGERLAFTAMQLEWVKVAEEEAVTLLSYPDQVLEFIGRMPGLLETCEVCPALVAQYAPQLTIRGFGGSLEEVFEAEYLASCEKERESQSGAACTTTGHPPLCHEDWALRHPMFGNYKPVHVACDYFSGSIFGPSVSPYKHADHVFWLLSSDSEWLPEATREVLIHGMRDWGQWHWLCALASDSIGDWVTNGALFDAMTRAREGKKFVWSDEIRNDLRRRIELSVATLNLTGSIDSIYDKFINYGFTQHYIDKPNRRQKRPKTDA